MNRCIYCGFYDVDIECCTCSSLEKWYACPIETDKPERKLEMDAYIKWNEESEGDNDQL